MRGAGTGACRHRISDLLWPEGQRTKLAARVGRRTRLRSRSVCLWCCCSSPAAGARTLHDHGSLWQARPQRLAYAYPCHALAPASNTLSTSLAPCAWLRLQHGRMDGWRSRVVQRQSTTAPTQRARPTGRRYALQDCNGHALQGCHRLVHNMDREPVLRRAGPANWEADSRAAHHARRL